MTDKYKDNHRQRSGGKSNRASDKFTKGKHQTSQSANSSGGSQQNKPKNGNGGRLKTNRGQAMRASRQNVEMAHKIASQFQDSSSTKVVKPRANVIDDSPKLRIMGLGGMDGGGSKNMIVIEYENEAIVMDCGIDLGVNLPGVNFAIPDTTYLERIKKKLKAYVITHGHLDHIGALPYIVQKLPAPIYGSRFTIGMVEQIFANSDAVDSKFELNTIIMNQDNHEKLKVGNFFIELVRVTHSIPGSTAVVVDTPLGKVINSGDFRLDPEPLDHKPTDIERFKQIGKEGVLVLMSESTTSERPGRTPTEQTLEPSFEELYRRSPGRVFVATFSTNINRIQMVVNGAVKTGRKVAFDGRSMMSTLETAVRLGFIKIPKGTLVPMASVNSMKDEEVIIVCTGSQGEMNSALQKMSIGDHKHIKLKEQDTVILSSTPIPETGNDSAIGNMVDDLMRNGVHVFRHETHEIDGAGPLHVSGHSSMDEYAEFINILKPRFFLPIYGSYRSKRRHIDIAVQNGIDRRNCINAENGDVVEVAKTKMYLNGHIENGSVLVDNTGAVVPNLVVKDRLVMAEDGIVTVILTLDKSSGKLLTSPDIISRGFIYMRDNEELMNGIRTELRRAASQRFSRVDVDRFKSELKDHITHFLFEHTQRSPIVIPVVNVIGRDGKSQIKPKPSTDSSHN